MRRRPGVVVLLFGIVADDVHWAVYCFLSYVIFCTGWRVGLLRDCCSPAATVITIAFGVLPTYIRPTECHRFSHHTAYHVSGRSAKTNIRNTPRLLLVGGD
jgi:hypothetical protein